MLGGLQVELAHSGQRGGRGGGGFGGPPPFRGGHDRGRDDRGPPPSRGRGDSYVPSKRSEFRVQITGLPRSASWQDLKDHMRPAGDITFSQVRHLLKILLQCMHAAVLEALVHTAGRGHYPIPDQNVAPVFLPCRSM